MGRFEGDGEVVGAAGDVEVGEAGAEFRGFDFAGIVVAAAEVGDGDEDVWCPAFLDGDFDDAAWGELDDLLVEDLVAFDGDEGGAVERGFDEDAGGVAFGVGVAVRREFDLDAVAGLPECALFIDVEGDDGFDECAGGVFGGEDEVVGAWGGWAEGERRAAAGGGCDGGGGGVGNAGGV